jgi:cystathionine gamma-synthase
MRDFGGMVSFIAAGGEAAARTIVERTELFFLAESLGGVESLIGHSASMSHSVSVGTATAVDPGLVRVSVGLETTEDLLADLRQALE